MRSPKKKLTSRLALSFCLVGLAPAFADHGSNVIISQSGQTLNGLAGSLTSFANPVLNNSGKVAFAANSNGDVGSATQALYLADGATLTYIVNNATLAPLVGGLFKGFDAPLINESGAVVFSADSSTGEAVYTSTGSGITPIAATGQAGQNYSTFPKAVALSDIQATTFQADVVTNNVVTGSSLLTGGSGSLSAVATMSVAAPGLGGNFSMYSVPVINNVGMVGIKGTTSTSAQGLYTTRGGSLTTIAVTGSAAPGLTGLNFTEFGEKSALNDKGTMAFLGVALNGSTKKYGVYTGAGAGLTTVVTTSQAAVGAGLTGNFTRFSDPTINNAGTVAFRGTDAAFTDGIFISLGGGNLRVVATGGVNDTYYNAKFKTLTAPAINAGGTVAYQATFQSGASAIYLGDGLDATPIRAIHTGQSLNGSTITSMGAFAGGADRGGASQFNDNGQIAYTAALANGQKVVGLYTPTLHFRSQTSGTWGTRTNWTAGLQPASVHDVIIDPTGTSLAVTGPTAAVTVKSLTIEGINGATASLALQSTGALTAPGGVTNGAHGALTGAGKINGNLTSAGLLAPGTPIKTAGLSITGNLFLESTSTLSLDLGGLLRKTSYDALNVGGTFTLGGALNIGLFNGFSPLAGQSFDLFDAGTFTGAFSALTLPTLTGGLEWNTTQLGISGIISVKPAGPVIASWSGPASGGLWTTAASWSGGAVPTGAGAQASFTGAGAPTSIATDGAKTVGAMVFNSAQGFTVTGEPITLNNGGTTPASIATQAGSHVVSAPVVLGQNTTTSQADGTALTLGGGVTGAGQSLTKTGGGTLNLQGAQAYGALAATDGVTNLAGSFSGGSVSVTGDAVLNSSASQVFTSFNLGGSGFGDEFGGSDFSGDPLSFSSPTPAAVPEPGTVALLASWSAIVLWRYRRVRR